MNNGGDEGSQGNSEGSADKESTIDNSNDDKVVIKGVMKCKAGVLKPEKGKKTLAWKGKSVYATATMLVSKKAKMGAEKITAITAKEEKTTQKVLGLKKLKARGGNDKALAKIKAKADLKMQQLKLKAELVQKKMDHDFQLQMARMGCFQTQPEAGPSSMGMGMFSSGYSEAGSTTPSVSDPGLRVGREFNFSRLGDDLPLQN